MERAATALSQQSGYLLAAAVAIACATCLEVFATPGQRPVIGNLSLLPLVLFAALVGLPMVKLLIKRGVSPDRPLQATITGTASILLLGGILALPPIAIDLATGFPQGMNSPLSDGLFFYPGIALVAEVAFHLLPLALLALLFSGPKAQQWLIWPVILVEPVFQLLFLSGSALMSILVLGNVALVSAVQLWLFRRYGFLAMFGLRLAFYLFWHILWGAARLVLLF